MSVSIQSASAIQNASVSGATGATPGMRDEFMRLFIAQLQHQDPLQPQDSSAFVAQLAQLSQVEQVAETNARLQVIAEEQAAAARASLSSLVGRTVSARAETLEIVRGAPTAQMSVTLDSPASEARLEILDGSGQVVRSVTLGAQAAGEVPVDPGALAGLAPGVYQVRVQARAAGGAAVSGSASVTGTIDAMQLDAGGGRFRIGSVSVSPAAIYSVGTSVKKEQP